MKNLEFEWDNNKEKINTRKHGVSFEEAQSAFYDEKAIQFYDPEHSDNEDRFILLGSSFKLNTLVVCHCFRGDETKIRIILLEKQIPKKSKPIGVIENERTLRLCKYERKEKSLHQISQATCNNAP
jgi:uncharacterized DUF497 family protein